MLVQSPTSPLVGAAEASHVMGAQKSSKDETPRRVPRSVVNLSQATVAPEYPSVNLPDTCEFFSLSPPHCASHSCPNAQLVAVETGAEGRALTIHGYVSLQSAVLDVTKTRNAVLPPEVWQPLGLSLSLAA